MGSNIPRQKGHGAKKTMKPIEANGGRVHDTETCGMLLSQVERVGGLCVGIGALSDLPPRSPTTATMKTTTTS